MALIIFEYSITPNQNFMAYEYRIKDQYGVYFVTFTVHKWVDVFTRNEYRDIVVDSLKYCQQQKGLQIYAWVIMTNHIHLIISSHQNKLSDIIRDFKKFTATKLIEAITNNPCESRRDWLLWMLKKGGNIWFWEEGYHGEEIYSNIFFDSKLNYIHHNPVRAGFVEKAEDYLYSSSGDYCGVRKGALDIIFA